MFLHCHEQVCISAISDARIQSGGWGLARQMHECTRGGLVGIQQFPPVMKWIEMGYLCVYLRCPADLLSIFGAGSFPHCSSINIANNPSTSMVTLTHNTQKKHSYSIHESEIPKGKLPVIKVSPMGPDAVSVGRGVFFHDTFSGGRWEKDQP